jgi:RNA polymerase sigma factor (sigma-70 family)
MSHTFRDAGALGATVVTAFPMGERPKGSPPSHLQVVLGGDEIDVRDAAWRSLIAEHSRLLMYVARSVAAEHDEAMDAYACVLEQLRSDDFRVLRKFASAGTGTFTTWLTVVARRMCVDFYRSRYGRLRALESNRPSAEARRDARRRLADLMAVGLDVTPLLKNDDADPEEKLRETELLTILQSVMVDLEPSDRLLLKLRFEDGLTAQEIATALEWPTQFHVFRRLNALFGLLRKRLQSRGVDNHIP